MQDHRGDAGQEMKGEKKGDKMQVSRVEVRIEEGERWKRGGKLINQFQEMFWGGCQDWEEEEEVEEVKKVGREEKKTECQDLEGREVSALAVPTDAAVIWATCPRMPAGHLEAWLSDSS